MNELGPVLTIKVGLAICRRRECPEPKRRRRNRLAGAKRMALVASKLCWVLTIHCSFGGRNRPGYNSPSSSEVLSVLVSRSNAIQRLFDIPVVRLGVANFAIACPTLYLLQEVLQRQLLSTYVPLLRSSSLLGSSGPALGPAPGPVMAAVRGLRSSPNRLVLLVRAPSDNLATIQRRSDPARVEPCPTI